jgi:hypothetical protein
MSGNDFALVRDVFLVPHVIGERPMKKGPET